VLTPRRFVAMFSAFLLFAGMLLSQSSSGTISGRVLDPSGQSVAGAVVRLTNQLLKDSRAFTTTAAGDFVFSDAQPGTYSIQVKMQGFKQFEQTNIELTASDRVSVGDLKLQIGSVTETMEVRSSGAQVQTASAERSGLLDSKQITDLMARGRDVMALLQTMPGVVDDATGSDTLGAFGTPTMDGIRQQYNSLNIDGISGNTARGSNAQSPINMDAITEVKVLANSYTAEYGTASGGVINLVTKSGTQQFHVGAYYYNRNEDFNADSFFNNRATPFIPRPRYRFNTVGYNVGGPVYWPHHFNTAKQKLFFFFSQEILPNQSPNATSNFTVPTALERTGDFSQSVKSISSAGVKTLYIVGDPNNKDASGKAIPFQNNMIPASRMDTNAVKLLSVFPLPNAVDPKLGYNYQIAGTENLPVKQEILRVDYNASEKMRWWFRASGFSSTNTGRTSAAISNQWGLADVGYQQTMPNLGANVTYIFSPTLVNEATFGYNLWTETQLLSQPALAAYQRATYGINIPQSYPKDNPLGLLPAVSFGNLGSNNAAAISYDGRFPMVDDATAITISDGLTKIWNNHVFKAGVHLEHILYNQYHQAGGNSFPGAFSFATNSSNPNDTGYAYANAFLGLFDTYNERTNRVDYAPITRITEWYLQDSWRVTRRLTVDVGLRFTYALPQSPNNNNAGNFVPYTFNPAQAPVLFRPAVVGGAKVVINPLTGATVLPVYSGLIVPNTGNPLNGIVTPTTPGFPSSMVFDNGILTAPRIGIAWDPFGNGKTAIRAGGGFFYNPRADAGTLGNLFFNPPAIYNPTQYYGTVGSVANNTGLLSPSSFSRDIDPHAKTVTSYHATFGIQRDIGWGTVVDVAYVGSFGRHLGEVIDLNQVSYGAQFLPQNQDPTNSGKPLNDNFFRPYPGYGSIPQQIFEGNSSYHSLQVQANRRFSKGVQFGVVYTHSKAMDYAEGDSTTGTNTVARVLDRRVWNYGVAGYDRPNVLTFNFLWDVPKLSRLLPNPVVRAVFDGWQIADITSFISGKPLGITMSTSPSVNFTGGGDGARPLMVGNPNLPSSQRTFDQWFNVAAFAEPIAIDPKTCTSSGCPPITIANIGDMPSLPIRGPRRNNWNTSVFKNFVIRERLQFQFRAEAYNTFNHTQFSGVDTSIKYNAQGQNTNLTAGQITSTYDARVLQLALRMRF
jgi:hypothetical protein